MLPTASCNLPEQQRRRRLNVVPIWSCSRWGLPCHSCCQERGVLLPRRFTLTNKRWRFVFCCTFPRVTPAGRYPAPFFYGARTFLKAFLKHPATAQPSYRDTMRGEGAICQQRDVFPLPLFLKHATI
jgi:hypothetical protein